MQSYGTTTIPMRGLDFNLLTLKAYVWLLATFVQVKDEWFHGCNCKDVV